ncbi:MAG: GNAT family N-acetyltransferase [Dehalococcoidia bacterium]|nr:GNAT family N-acetyltransferase [Dehalococcoidia bacterium]
MNSNFEIVTVDATNVAKHGFFCQKSKPKSAGYQRKLAWLKQRFSEGMKLKLACENGKSVGFIEYVPGEFAWRAVRARDYMVIHCLWVVGRAKGKGYGSRLVDDCLEDARRSQKQGVAVVTSNSNMLAGKELFLRHGFEVVDQAPPSFELLVKEFGNAPPPAFPTDWRERQVRYGSGLTIIRSDQCPYVDDATNQALEWSREFGVEPRVIELKTSHEAQESAPSAFGVFNIVHDGELFAHHCLLKKESFQRLGSHPG